MDKKTLCETCICWVDCGKKENKPYGFCLARDFFTYTAETEYREYVKGVPSTEQEWEDFLKERIRKTNDYRKR